VGSILRTADGAGVTKIFVCGICPKPNDEKVKKTALGAEKEVSWEYHKQTWRLLKKLKNENSKIKILALERFDPSIKFRASKLDVINIFKYSPPKNYDLAIIVGNEVTGLNKKILSYADKIVEIPMLGKKESLNVSVATGIALYTILNKKV